MLLLQEALKFLSDNGEDGPAAIAPGDIIVAKVDLTPEDKEQTFIGFGRASEDFKYYVGFAGGNGWVRGFDISSSIIRHQVS